MRFVTGALVALTMAVPGVAMAGPIANGQGWTGFYVGGHVGGVRATFDGVFDNNDQPSDQIRFDEFEEWGFGAGGQIGFDYQPPVLGGSVIGIVADGSWVSIDESATGLPDGNMAGVSIDWIASVRLRAGYPVADIMPYVTVGAAWAELDAFIQDDGDPALSIGSTEIGYVGGFGIDWAVAPNVTVGAEALIYDFDYVVDLDATGHPDTDPGDFFEFDRMMQFRLTANYRF